MPYDKDSLNEAKKMGVFDNNALDPRILELNEDEKKRLSDDLNKATQDMAPEKTAPDASTGQRKKKNISLDVELSAMEQIIMFFLSFFGLTTPEKYKIGKVIKTIEKDLIRIKPPIYITSTRRVSKYFMYKLHDLYLKLIWLRRLFANTFDNKALWDNPNARKTVVEVLFENLANVNSDEITSNFSFAGIDTILKQIEDPKRAVEAVEKKIYAYIYGIDKSSIEQANEMYTNMLYFKALVDFDFLSLFRRFDGSFHPGTSPNFMDVPGEAIVSYLKVLEEAMLQIDLVMDNIQVFKRLQDISNSLSASTDEVKVEEVVKTDSQTNPDIISPDKLEGELILLFEVMKELMNKRQLTLLIQIIKSDPLYAPSFIHAKYDLFKIYVETFEKRVKMIVRTIIKDRRNQKLEGHIKKLFVPVKFMGIYNVNLSDELEKENILGFTYAYNMGIIFSFMERYYSELIKTTLNKLLLNGSFTEKNFHKMISDSFYGLDNYYEKLTSVNEEFVPEGPMAKKFLSLIARKNQHPDQKKIIEKQIVVINGKMKDLYEEFLPLFSSMSVVIARVFTDVDAKPPKYVRNIRAIEGYQNVKFLQILEKSNQILQVMQELLNLLKV